MSTQTVPTERLHTVISIDPSTGEEIGRAALMTAADVGEAVRFARAAQPAWSKLSYD